VSETPDASAQHLSLRHNLLYGLGHFGLSVLGYMIVARVVPFYGEGQGSALPVAGGVLSAGALIALVLFVTRSVDLIADPLVGFFSDRTHSRWGRRKPYMLVSAPLLVLSFILVWRPPDASATVERAWYAGILLTAFFVCFAGYAAPYLGLLPEIARTPAQRSRLATTQGVFHLLGTAVASVAVGLVEPLIGLGTTTVVLGVLCLATLWLALLGPRETEADQGPPAQFGLGRALRQTLANRPFLIYWAGYYLYWVPLLVVIAGVEAAPPRWAVLGPDGAGSILIAPLVGGLLLLPLARRLVAQRGPRWVFLAGLAWMAVTAPALVLLRHIPQAGTGGPWLAYLLAGLLAPAVAALFSVPYLILADVCDLDYRRLGQHREAMYFGFQGLVMKAGWGIAPLLVAVVTRFFVPDLGPWMFGPLAGGMALLGFIIFWFYPERGVCAVEEQPPAL
jgi:GPH family glycoside/pentoside/hexuronide:cation symporter